MRDFFVNHKWAVILSVIALIIVLLFYLIGFWWTLLAGLFVVIAIFFGRMMDRDGAEGVKDFFRKLFRGKRA